MGFRKIILIIIVVLKHTAGFCQPIGIDTDEIESLIDEWNFAHNTRNVHSFEKVYDDNLVFYTESVTRRHAIALKQQLFKLKPYFRQRITTEIAYKPYSRGVIKCDFTKEVFEKTHWKKYPSYLLVSYEDNHYSIVGESDYATDRVLRYKLDIGDPITFEKAPEVRDTFTVDSAQALTDTEVITAPPISATPADDSDFSFGFEDLGTALSDISSLGMIAVPKGYIYILIGMLLIGGLMIVLADRARKTPVKTGKVIQRHTEAEHVVKDFKIQSGFEAFVVTLFDPLFFKCKRFKNEHVYAGQEAPAEKGPDFVFDFSQNETSGRFAIKCQYYRNIAKKEVQLFTADRQRLFRQFEEDRDIDLYYVLGFGGAPDDPNELFFLPAKAVKGEYISKAALRQYSKSGMFYYNRKTGMIQ